MATMVVVDDLRDVGQAREQRLEAGVVVAGAAMQENEGRLFAELRAVGDEGRAFDVDEETELGRDGNAHPALERQRLGATANKSANCAFQKRAIPVVPWPRVSSLPGMR